MSSIPRAYFDFDTLSSFCHTVIRFANDFVTVRLCNTNELDNLRLCCHTAILRLFCQ
jgi:hypothetical protein